MDYYFHFQIGFSNWIHIHFLIGFLFSNWIFIFYLDFHFLIWFSFLIYHLPIFVILIFVLFIFVIFVFIFSFAHSLLSDFFRYFFSTFLFFPHCAPLLGWRYLYLWYTWNQILLDRDSVDNFCSLIAPFWTLIFFTISALISFFLNVFLVILMLFLFF